jgi:cobalt-precorrin-5B (C1)-methyltransferase
MTEPPSPPPDLAAVPTTIPAEPPAAGTALRRGWTTGACATAAVTAAFSALAGAGFPDPVTITLPGGRRPAFPLALEGRGDGWARAGVVKDAGDDPDVTHGVTVIASVRWGMAGGGVVFRAGPGVGTVTRPGLPLDVGEPAINPVPRRLMTEAVGRIAARLAVPADVEVELSIPGGERIAERTWNPRLGILGGLSVLGTTGVVIPYSCAAWIHSIRRGVDVARAAGLDVLAGCTGSTSETAVRAHCGLPELAMIDMGDFVGGFLKYVRSHPVRQVIIGGGFAKLSKLAGGALDLHSARSQVDLGSLGELTAQAGGGAGVVEAIAGAHTALGALRLAQAAGVDLAGAVARRARQVSLDVLGDPSSEVELIVVDRDGTIAAVAR